MAALQSDILSTVPLADRIQGFGNFNPPPLEDEAGVTLAKKAVVRLGDKIRQYARSVGKDTPLGSVMYTKRGARDRVEELRQRLLALQQAARENPTEEIDAAAQAIIKDLLDLRAEFRARRVENGEDPRVVVLSSVGSFRDPTVSQPLPEGGMAVQPTDFQPTEALESDRSGTLSISPQRTISKGRPA